MLSLPHSPISIVPSLGQNLIMAAEVDGILFVGREKKRGDG
jgi:hypothetical protein